MSHFNLNAVCSNGAAQYKYLMRNIFLIVVLALVGQINVHAQDETKVETAPKQEETNMESVSYSLGILVAQNLKNQGFKDINIEEFGAAIDDVLQDRETKVSPTQANETVQQYMAAAKASQHKVNKDAGEAFLAENKLRGEVVTTESGLQYEVITEGQGSKPKATDEVEVHYHGTLIDGTVFDSSVQRGKTTSFPLNRVISGWTEGLQLMSVGSKYKFYIPYNLAYGDQGAGAQIKPFSALVFEVELISIK